MKRLRTMLRGEQDVDYPVDGPYARGTPDSIGCEPPNSEIVESHKLYTKPSIDKLKNSEERAEPVNQVVAVLNFIVNRGVYKGENHYNIMAINLMPDEIDDSRATAVIRYEVKNNHFPTIDLQVAHARLIGEVSPKVCFEKAFMRFGIETINHSKTPWFEIGAIIHFINV